jgi:hypothetical protein
MELVPLCSAPKSSATSQEVLECYNIVGENQEDKDRRNFQVQETRERLVEGVDLEYVEYLNPLKHRKVNIGTKDNTKFAHIGDDWNEEMVENIIDLLREY